MRLVGDGNDRHVPESEAHRYGNRVVALSDGRRVVLTERVHEFLDWAQNFYEISVCSLGDQTMSTMLSVSLIHSGREFEDYTIQHDLNTTISNDPMIPIDHPKILEHCILSLHLTHDLSAVDMHYHLSLMMKHVCGPAINMIISLWYAIK